MKKTLKLIWDDFIRGGIFTSISASALIISVSLILGKSIKNDFILIVFLLSVIIYFFNFIGELKDDFIDNRKEYLIMKNRKNFLLATIIFLTISSLYISLRLANTYSFIFILVFLSFGILYTLGLKKITNYIVGFKDIYVTICWNLIIPFFLIYHSYEINSSILFLMAFVFSRDLLNVSYCDIKDLEVDKKSGLLTFANVFGRNKLLGILQFLNIISIAILIIGTSLQLVNSIALYLLIPIILTGILIETSRRKNNFSTLFVDIEYTIWLLVLSLAKNL